MRVLVLGHISLRKQRGPSPSGADLPLDLKLGSTGVLPQVAQRNLFLSRLVAAVAFRPTPPTPPTSPCRYLAPPPRPARFAPHTQRY